MTPHDKQIPPAIKEAAKLYCSKYNHGYQDQLKEIFCDAALHPETEKYYRKRFEADVKGLIKLINENGTLTLDLKKGTELHSQVKIISENGSVNLLDILNLYKQSLNKKNEND